MILFLQFTITDSRVFSLIDLGQLTKPRWPSPTPFREFVRGTGSIVERSKKGLDTWVGENFICKIKSGMRFSDDNHFSNGVLVKNISKHLYANEHYILTKYEMVFDVKLPIGKNLLGYELLKTLVDELLLAKVKIRFNGKDEDVNISDLPEALIEFHYQNTTKTDVSITGLGKNHILKCTPQLYFYLENNEKSVKLGKNYNQIAEIPGFAMLFGAWHNHKNNPFRIWVHQRNSKSHRFSKNRETRMMIMRLHSEYECLNNIFLAISQGIINVAARSSISDELQDYFNVAIRRFLYDSADLGYNLWSKKYFDYFNKIYAKASPGELDIIRKKINTFNFRINIDHKTIEFLTQNYTVNKYENHNSTIISQGDNNQVSNNHVTQNINSEIAPIDFENLVIELQAAINRAQSEATGTAEIKEILALSEAHDAAVQKDQSKVLTALKSCGKFALDIANKMTASILVELLKNPTAFS